MGCGNSKNVEVATMEHRVRTPDTSADPHASPKTKPVPKKTTASTASPIKDHDDVDNKKKTRVDETKTKAKAKANKTNSEGTGSPAKGSKGGCCSSSGGKGPGYATPMDAFRQGPREKLLYTACTYVSTGHDSADYLATVDCDPESPTYSTVVSRVYGTAPGDELHHFAWSACASCHDDPSKERRFLVVPGLASARIYIIDTADARAPKLHKVIEPEEVRDKTDLTAGHTTHCLADGTVMIAMLGEGDGSAPGGYLLLNDDFSIRGRWEAQGPGLQRQTFSYDFWYQPSHNVMLSSGWGAPSTFAPGFDPADVASGRYSKEIHIWDWTRREIVARVDLDESGWLPLELRFHHDPDSTHAFVGAALGSSIWHIYLDEAREEWVFEKVVQVAPVGNRPGFPNDEMPGLVTDLLLSMDDRYMYFSCWLHGDVRQYDISDPSRPVLTGRVVVGGMLGAGATVRGNTIVGGPQMLQLSLDGRRLYVTTSLYSTWDNQFYPAMKEAGGCMFMIDVDHDKGGMTLNQSFFVDFGREPRGASRCHETRYPGGDCTSDIYVSHKRKTWDKPPSSRHRINKLDLTYQRPYEVQAYGAESLEIDRGLPQEIVVRVGPNGRGGGGGSAVKELRIAPGASFERFKVAVQEAVGRVSVIRYGGHVLRTEADKEAAVVDAVVRGQTQLLLSAEDVAGSRDHLPPFGAATGRAPGVAAAYRQVEFALGAAPDVMLVHVAEGPQRGRDSGSGSGGGAGESALAELRKLAPRSHIHLIYVATDNADDNRSFASAASSSNDDDDDDDDDENANNDQPKCVTIFAAYDTAKCPSAVGACERDAETNDPRVAAAKAVRSALISVGFSPAMLRRKPTLVILSGRMGDGAEVTAGVCDVLGQGVPMIGGLFRSGDATLLAGVPEGGVAGARTAPVTCLDAQVVVTLYFSERPVSTAVELPSALTAHVADVTSVSGNEITSLGGQPAAEVYRAWTGGLVSPLGRSGTGASSKGGDASGGLVPIDPRNQPTATTARSAALFPLVTILRGTEVHRPARKGRRKGALDIGVPVQVGDRVGLGAATSERAVSCVAAAAAAATSAASSAAGGAGVGVAIGFVPRAMASAIPRAVWNAEVIRASFRALGSSAAVLAIPADDIVVDGIVTQAPVWATLPLKLAVPLADAPVFVFHRVPAMDALLAWDRVATQAALATALAVQVRQCALHGGYDLHGDGRVTVFPDGRGALAYVTGLMSALLVADWPRDLLFRDEADTNVAGSDDVSEGGGGTTYERGLRIAVGVHAGHATRSIDPTTGRVAYAGSALNTAARLCSLAAAGQCVVSAAALALMRPAVAERKGTHEEVAVKPLGKKTLKGVKGKVEAFEVLPTELAAHRFFGYDL